MTSCMRSCVSYISDCMYNGWQGSHIKGQPQVTLAGQFLLLYMKSGVDETTNRVAREVRKTSH